MSNSKKLEIHPSTFEELPHGDYVSPGLVAIDLDDCFPNMVAGDPTSSTWPYLRREILHNWYVDARNPSVGFLSRDEAAVLYNSALLFKGRPSLEIGCWRGWSTAHCALATGTLDVIDPILNDESFFRDVRCSLGRAGVLEAVTFYPDYSPSAVERIGTAAAKLWSFVFVDGDHEGDAPVADAEVVSRYAAENALVLFHDLASPEVANGLESLRSQGWNTMLYQTMQIMGVAWRGSVTPIDHTPDPTQNWTLPDHLVDFRVSGRPESEIKARKNGKVFPVMISSQLTSELASLRSKDIENSKRLAELGLESDKNKELAARLSAILPDLNSKITDLQFTNDNLMRGLREAEELGLANKDQIRTLQTERDLLSRVLSGLQSQIVEVGSRLAQFDARAKSLESELAAKDAQLKQLERSLFEKQDELRRRPTPNIVAADLRQIQERVERLYADDCSAQYSSGAVSRQKESLARTLHSRAAGLSLANYIGGTRVLLGLLRRRVVHGRVASSQQVERILLGFGSPLSKQVENNFTAWFGNLRDLFGLVRRSLTGRSFEAKAIILWKLNECLQNEHLEFLPEMWAMLDSHCLQGQDFTELCKYIQSLAAVDVNLMEQSFTTRLAMVSSQSEERIGASRKQVETILAERNVLEKRFKDLEAAKVAEEHALLNAEIELAALRLKIDGANGTVRNHILAQQDGTLARGAAI